jgi:hypothetical protein
MIVHRPLNRPRSTTYFEILSVFGMTSPWGEKWNPPRDFGAICLIFRAETCPQSRFFVKQHKKVKQQPDKPAICKQRRVSKKRALTENGARDRRYMGLRT